MAPYLAAIIPCLLILWYVYHRDAYPEPPRVVAATFALGVLTLIPLVAFYEIVGDALESCPNVWGYAFGAAFLVAALPEELVKFLVLYLYCRRHSAFDEPMDGIVYGVAASLGFAAVENVFYVLDDGLATALIRAVTAVPSHAADGAVMGFFFGLAHAHPHRKRALLAMALFLPVLLHGIYDYPLMLTDEVEMALRGAAHLVDDGFELAVFPVMLVEFVLAALLFRRLRALQRQAAPAD